MKGFYPTGAAEGCPNIPLLIGFDPELLAEERALPTLNWNPLLLVGD